MDNKQKDIKGRDKTAGQVKDDKNKNMPYKKTSDDRSDDKNSNDKRGDKKGDMNRTSDKKSSTKNK